MTSPATREFSGADLAGSETPAKRFRVVVADNEALLRRALASLLDRLGFDMIGLAGTAEQLIAEVVSLLPEFGGRTGLVTPGRSGHRGRDCLHGLPQAGH
jgi:hypothetical protein